jgi:hypothetical protein
MRDLVSSEPAIMAARDKQDPAADLFLQTLNQRRNDPNPLLHWSSWDDTPTTAQDMS